MVPNLRQTRPVRLNFVILLPPSEGKAEGEADALRTVLLARGFTVDPETDARIAACRDTVVLRAWITRAVSARALDDVFAP